MARYNVQKCQRELEEQREEWSATIAYQISEQILHLERQLAEAEEVQMQLEKESRNSV